MLRSPFALLLLAGTLGLLAACGGPSQGPASSDADRPRHVVDGVVQCFPDGGPIAFEVEGVAVPEATVERFATLMRTRMPQLTEEQARLKAILEQIIPQAAAYAHYRERVQAASERIAEIRRRLEEGEDFEDLARELSDDPNAAPKGGSLGMVGRDRQPFLSHLAMQDIAWSVDVGGISPPIATVLGLNLIRVSEEVPGASEAADKRALHYILVGHDPQALKDGTWRGLLEGIVNRARVEIRDEKYKKLLPSRLWHR